MQEKKKIKDLFSAENKSVVLVPLDKKRISEILYGFPSSPFGLCFIALCGGGILEIAFIKAEEKSLYLKKLKTRFPQAVIQEDYGKTRDAVSAVFQTEKRSAAAPFRVLAEGTVFQMTVWNALLLIPYGRTVSYKDIAEFIGRPGACRAVGNAVGSNPAAWLIPCHRVINADGRPGNYRWGRALKEILLNHESSFL